MFLSAGQQKQLQHYAAFVTRSHHSVTLMMTILNEMKGFLLSLKDLLIRKFLNEKRSLGRRCVDVQTVLAYAYHMVHLSLP